MAVGQHGLHDLITVQLQPVQSASCSRIMTLLSLMQRCKGMQHSAWSGTWAPWRRDGSTSTFCLAISTRRSAGASPNPSKTPPTDLQNPPIPGHKEDGLSFSNRCQQVMFGRGENADRCGGEKGRCYGCINSSRDLTAVLLSPYYPYSVSTPERFVGEVLFQLALCL